MKAAYDNILSASNHSLTATMLPSTLQSFNSSHYYIILTLAIYYGQGTSQSVSALYCLCTGALQAVSGL